MSRICFVTSFTGARLNGVTPTHESACVSLRQGPRTVVSMSKDKDGQQKGFFGKIKESIMRPLVSVPGGSSKSADLLECVFCSGKGRCDCDACKGSGKDSLGTCFMCNGKTSLTCTVCNGFGAVDRIRRGGTDDSSSFFKKDKKKMD